MEPINSESNKINVWYITGATSGTGLSIAQKVLENPNNRVVGTSRDLKKFESLAISKNPNFLALKVSGLEDKEIKDSVEKAIQHFGTITHVVNNAGYSTYAAVEEASDSDIKELFEILYYYPLKVIRAVLPHMRSKRHGYIFNISSVVSYFSMTGLHGYSAAKSALTSSTNILAAEVKPFGINVAAISLGYFKTGFQNGFVSDDHYIDDYKTKHVYQTQMVPYFLTAIPGDTDKFADILVNNYGNQAEFKYSNLFFGTDHSYDTVEKSIKHNLDQFSLQKETNTKV